MQGWSEDISKVTDFADLPSNAKKYVLRTLTALFKWIGSGCREGRGSFLLSNLDVLSGSKNSWAFLFHGWGPLDGNEQTNVWETMNSMSRWEKFQPPEPVEPAELPFVSRSTTHSELTIISQVGPDRSSMLKA